MKRFFNTTGLCNTEDHYMVDPFRNMYKNILHLIHSKQYFLIHAPRQTGKTTFLHALAHRLNKEGNYVSVVCSLESAGYNSISVEAANINFIKALAKTSKLFIGTDHLPPDIAKHISGSSMLGDYLTDWCDTLNKPLILLLDEVDALYDDVLISTLRQLRDGFQTRPKYFPQSIVMAGLRDIRDFRTPSPANIPSIGSGSIFNIIAESFFLPAFSKEEVRGLLNQHTQNTGQVFSKEVLEKLYDYSGGQPWLTNSLANEVVREILKNDYSLEITLDLIELAKERLIEQRQTHLDSLADKINDPRVRPIIMSIITGDSPAFDGADDAIRYCRDLGIISIGNPIQFANPIYREIITRILTIGFSVSINQDIAQTSWYLNTDGSLNIDKLLDAFTDFYRWNSESWIDRYKYKEAGHQLFLMAFLQRIINGGGRIEREMATGNGRTDLVIFWKSQVITIEIKMHHDTRSEPHGIQQLARYLDRLGQKTGYMVFLEKKSAAELSWEDRIRREVHIVNNKEIIIYAM